MKVECSFDYAYSRPVIPVIINNTKLQALVDTGAEVPVILVPKFSIARLGLRYIDGGHKLTGFGGTVICDRYKGDLCLNEITFKNVSFLASTMPQTYSLVLPASLFIDFDATISNSTKVFKIENSLDVSEYDFKVRDKEGNSLSLTNSYTTTFKGASILSGDK